MSNTGAFQFELKDNGIGYIKMDVPGEAHNTLKAEFVGEISALLDDIEANKANDMVDEEREVGQDLCLPPRNNATRMPTQLSSTHSLTRSSVKWCSV